MAKTKISELEKKLLETEAALKRALADYANLEKRIAAERQVIGKITLANLIVKLLPILDNLDKAASHTKDDGVSLVVKQFKETLDSLGCKEVGSVGEKFDPKFHEAIEVVKGDKDDKIVEVIAPGFVLDGQVVRPAKVKVGKIKVEKERKEKATRAADFGDYA